MPDVCHPHPDRKRLVKRVQGLAAEWERESTMPLFRFIDPRYSKSDDIVNGLGARYASGRWHLIGANPLSYTATQPETALAETMAHARYFRLPVTSAFPRVLVSLDFRASRVLDLRDGLLRRILRLSWATMARIDWRKENRHGREAITQAWGALLEAAGYEAVIVPSAATLKGTNVLVFPRNLRPGSEFKVTKEVEWPQ